MDELQVQRKREVETRQESTMPARVFMPVTDIFETDQALTLTLELPGVAEHAHGPAGDVRQSVEAAAVRQRGEVEDAVARHDGHAGGVQPRADHLPVQLAPHRVAQVLDTRAGFST